MHVKCRNCPDVRFKLCNSKNIITEGKLCCEVEQEETKAVCSQCGEKLAMGHFAIDGYYEFWCEDCIRELAESLEV